MSSQKQSRNTREHLPPTSMKCFAARPERGAATFISQPSRHSHILNT